jgi:O-methyltransferase
MKSINNLLELMGLRLTRENRRCINEQSQLKAVFEKYKAHTMVPEAVYIANLKLVRSAANITGDIYECGVWKGGMIAGIAELLGNQRKYYLFDSFEGLPDAGEIDGDAAIAWQQNKEAPGYFNNCAAGEEEAVKAMCMARVDYKIVKGRFSQSLPLHRTPGPIAVLRLDGDWYESTFECLTYLYSSVNHGGIIIIDDYYAWEGCSKAVHDYLSSIKSSSRIYKTAEDVAYIIKTDMHGN